MLQLNKKRIVQGRLDAERLFLQLGSLDNKDVLNLGMGAELFVQVFNEAKEKSSRELLSPNDSAVLFPLKQLKLLYVMLCQELKGNGETNVHLTDLLDALKMAITNPSANGERELPETLPLTPGSNPHSSTKNVTLDGAEFRVYKLSLIHI